MVALSVVVSLVVGAAFNKIEPVLRPTVLVLGAIAYAIGWQLVK